MGRTPKPFQPAVPAPRGFLGRGGGRWGRIPQLPSWITTSVQLCGINPFASGVGAPSNGAPLGTHLRSGAWVGLDPDSLYKSGVITSPTFMLFGLNGFGKSTTAQTMTLCMMARGMVPCINDPIKREHVALARAAGSTVLSMGSGLDRLNLLGAGPLDDAAARIGGDTARQLRMLAERKAADLVRVMFRIARGGRDVHEFEDTCLDILVAHIRATNPKPVTADLLTVYLAAPETVLHQLGFSEPGSFHTRFADLGETLRSMLAGELGQLLGGVEAVRIPAGNPGGFCFDLSAIGETNTAQLSAAMLATWSLSMDAIDAHWELALHEQARAEEAANSGDRYTPEVFWHGYVNVMDEFWYPIRHVPGIVDAADRLARTNRSKGVAEIKITHSPRDFDSLPRQEDRTAAMGLASKSGLIGTMALAEEDLSSLARVRDLTVKERDTIKSFGGADAWTRAGQTDASGKPRPPEGAGKVLFKVAGLPGVPVRMVQPSLQERLHITDERMRAANRADREVRA